MLARDRTEDAHVALAVGEAACMLLICDLDELRLGGHGEFPGELPGPQIGSADEVVVRKDANIVMPEAFEHHSEVEGIDRMARGSTLSHYVPRTHGAVVDHRQMSAWTHEP